MRLTINRKIAILALIPILAFITFASFMVWNKWQALEVAKTMTLNIRLISTASGLITQLQQERGRSNLFLNGAIDQNAMASQRARTDRTQATFLKSLRQAKISANSRGAAQQALSQLAGLRSDVDSKVSMSQSFEGYTGLINAILATETAAVKAKTTGGIGKKLADVALFENAGENAGKLRGMLSGLLASNKPLSGANLETLISLNARVHAGIESPALSVPKDMEERIQSFADDPAWVEVNKVFQLVLHRAAKGNYGVDPKAFFKSASKQVDDIHALEKQELGIINKVIDRFEANATNSIWWNFALLICLILVIAGVSIASGRSISLPIAKLTGQLAQTSDKVSAGATDVASSSQQLAEGASQQAAAIEETSSSLEEMASMTKLNADNASQADALMKETNDVVSNAVQAMDRLISSMQEISRASESIQKIIKTIDEIAFQTNLLALNAAVEAARAGEAGAGFAVVADEVRNLAMRAAEAARNTADLIEGTAVKINDGMKLVTTTNEAFVEVADKSSSAGQLVGEIAAASLEQAQGIDQVNKAVAEMDKVVQQNAAGAEESASASEEMKIQAEQLKRFVEGLRVMVQGMSAAAAEPGSAHESQTKTRDIAAVSTVRPVPANRGNGHHRSAQERIPSPEQMIPLDEGDFTEF